MVFVHRLPTSVHTTHLSLSWQTCFLRTRDKFFIQTHYFYIWCLGSWLAKLYKQGLCYRSLRNPYTEQEACYKIRLQIKVESQLKLLGLTISSIRIHMLPSSTSLYKYCSIPVSKFPQGLGHTCSLVNELPTSLNFNVVLMASLWVLIQNPLHHLTLRTACLWQVS